MFCSEIVWSSRVPLSTTVKLRIRADYDIWPSRQNACAGHAHDVTGIRDESQERKCQWWKINNMRTIELKHRSGQS